ncbi:diguanylate cyclase [Iodobacter sp.]|uniref:diguanylate cyclase n=1 Tax=Iodobacter sp. TaxID=1915058 RepID=UPI0025EA674B|nr:diguanylate cyclase [Iodobacter sp.]
MLKLLIVLFVCGLPSLIMASQDASPLVLNANSSGGAINGQLEYFIDPSEKMSFDEVRSKADFTACQGRTVLAQIHHPVWFRLKLERTPNTPKRWWIDYSLFTPPELWFYAPDEKGNYTVKKSTKLSLLTTRSETNPQYLLPFDFNHELSTTLYWRATSYSAYIFPLKVWQLEDWTDKALKKYLFYGALMGVMLGLAIYNLLIYFRLKDRIFLIYFFTIISYMFFTLNVSSLGWRTIGLAELHQYFGITSIVVAITGMFSILFAISLLGDYKQKKWFDFIMYAAVLVYLFALGLVALGRFTEAEKFTQWAGALWLPPVLLMSIYLSFKGSLWARYYLLGEGPTVVGNGLLVMVTQGVIEANSFNTKFYFIAGAWSAILFSQALAEKVNSLKREKAAALRVAVAEKTARLLEAEEYKNSLEEKVSLRTKELSVEVLMHKITSQQLRVSQTKLEEMAYSDALTGLPNRRMFQDRLVQAFTWAQRQQCEFALALVDLDHFKRINDSMGHGAGDQLLHLVAQRLNYALRHCDTVARLGGDEFALIFTAPISREGAITICQRILASFDELVVIDGQLVQVGMSIGLAWYPADGDDMDALIGSADVALYQAKAAGRHTLRYAGYLTDEPKLNS